MRIENLLFSAVQFFLVLVTFCAGLFFIALPWSPHVRFLCSAFLAQRDDIFIPLGALLLTVAVILGIGFYFLQRRAYFQVRMSTAIHVEKELICQLLEVYWKNRYPEENLKTEVVLHPDQRLELIAELPFIKNTESQKLLKEVEIEIGRLIYQQLGYKQDFLFTFQIR